MLRLVDLHAFNMFRDFDFSLKMYRDLNYPLDRGPKPLIRGVRP